jgi:hypothetical protein
VSHNTLIVFELTILVLAIFLGFEVISKVPTLAAHAVDVGHERDPTGSSSSAR